MRTRLVRQQCKNRLSFPSHGHGDGDDACRGGQEDPASKIGNLKQYGELPETARINETAVDMAMVVCSAEINLSLRILNRGLHAIDASTRLTG